MPKLYWELYQTLTGRYIAHIFVLYMYIVSFYLYKKLLCFQYIFKINANLDEIICHLIEIFYWTTLEMYEDITREILWYIPTYTDIYFQLQGIPLS